MPDETELTPEEVQSEREGVSKELWGEDTKIDALPTDTDIEPAAKPAESEPDEWAGVSPALRERFELMGKKLEDYDVVSERLKQAESRIGGITNKLHEAEKTNATLSEEREAAPSKEEVDAAAKDDEAWDELKDEFPVWAEAIDSRLAAERAKLDKSLKTIEDMKEKLSGSDTGQVDLERIREELRVEIRHPGWEDTVKLKEYGEWFARQSPEVQEKANSVKSVDAIEVLDLYNDRTSGGGKTPAQIEAERKKRLTNSELPSGHRRTPAAAEDDMTDDEFRQKAANEIFAD